MRANTLLAIISALMAIFSAEIGMRFFSPSGPHSAAPFNSQDLDLKNHQYRQNPGFTSSENAYLFFGGSYTFGLGVKDQETFGAQFSQLKKEPVYNYAGNGFGPHHMLRLIETKNFRKKIPPHHKQVKVYFFSYAFHKERLMGGLHWIGAQRTNDPYYRLEKNKLVYMGNFATGRTFLTKLYWYLYHSRLVRALWPRSFGFNELEAVNLTCSIINQSQYLLKKQFNNHMTFTFVQSPLQHQENSQDYFDNVQKCLSSQINFLKIDSPQDIELNQRKWKLNPPRDNHPTPFAHKWLAQKLFEKAN